jgi:hypothetical protein
VAFTQSRGSQPDRCLECLHSIALEACSLFSDRVRPLLSRPHHRIPLHDVFTCTQSGGPTTRTLSFYTLAREPRQNWPHIVASTVATTKVFTLLKSCCGMDASPCQTSSRSQSDRDDSKPYVDFAHLRHIAAASAAVAVIIELGNIMRIRSHYTDRHNPRLGSAEAEGRTWKALRCMRKMGTTAKRL